MIVAAVVLLAFIIFVWAFMRGAREPEARSLLTPPEPWPTWTPPLPISPDPDHEAVCEAAERLDVLLAKKRRRHV